MRQHTHAHQHSDDPGAIHDIIVRIPYKSREKPDRLLRLDQKAGKWVEFVEQ